MELEQERRMGDIREHGDQGDFANVYNVKIN